MKANSPDSRTPLKLTINTNINAGHQRQALPVGKARDLIFSNRIQNPRSAKSSKSTHSRIGTSSRSPQLKANSFSSPTHSPLLFSNKHAANLYRASPYIKGNLSNLTPTPVHQRKATLNNQTHIQNEPLLKQKLITQPNTPQIPILTKKTASPTKKNGSQLRTAVSAKSSPNSAGPPIRRLPSSPSKQSPLKPSTLPTEKKSKPTATKPNTPFPSQNSKPAHLIGYAVGLHSNTSTKLNAILQKDIDELDEAIFSLLNKHELQSQSQSLETTHSNQPIHSKPNESPVIPEPKIIEASKDENLKKKFSMLKGSVAKSPPQTTAATPSPKKKFTFFEKSKAKEMVSPIYNEDKLELISEIIESHLPTQHSQESPLVPLRKQHIEPQVPLKPPKLVIQTQNPLTSNTHKSQSLTPDSKSPSKPQVKQVKVTVSSPPIASPTKSIFKSNPITVSTAQIPEQSTSTQNACKFCSRTFNADRLSIHEKVCQTSMKSAKTREKKRGVEDKKKAKEDAMKDLINERERHGKVARPKVDWRAAHGMF